MLGLFTESRVNEGFLWPLSIGMAGLIAGGDGNLWLRKPVSMDFPDARYDVVDRNGVLLVTLTLGKGERIVGVSRTAIYVVCRDEVEGERLRRHPWTYAPTKG